MNLNLTPWKNKERESDGRDVKELLPFNALQHEVNTIFDRFFRDPWFGRSDLISGLSMDWAPSMDVAETDKEIQIRLEVPGVDPKNLDVNVSGNVLTVQGEKSEESRKEDKNFFHSERRFGSFRRSIELPSTVDIDTVSAEQKNGVVTITMQKTPSATSKKIAITQAKS